MIPQRIFDFCRIMIVIVDLILVIKILISKDEDI